MSSTQTSTRSCRSAGASRLDAPISLQHHGTSVLRKKVARALNSAAQEHKHLISIAYNKSNRLLSAEDVARVFGTVGMVVPVRDLTLFQQALVHRSYLAETLSIDEPARLDASGLGFVEHIRTTWPELDEDLARALPNLVAERYVGRGDDVGAIVPLQDTCCERLEYLGDSVLGRAPCRAVS